MSSKRGTAKEEAEKVRPGSTDGYQAIAIDLSPVAIGILKHLQRTGLYGFTVEEVAERLLSERLRGFVSMKGVE